MDPSFPLTWRLQREQAGSGALGDLGSAHRRPGPVPDRRADHRRLRGHRHLRRRAPAARGRPAGAAPGPVTVDDAALFTARLGRGALASFEATRFAAGRKNALRIELNGDRGSLAFDLERLNELQFYDRARTARGRLPAHPGHRARPSVPVRLVAAGPRARLGAHVHARGRGPGHRHRRRAPTRRRRSPTACRCSGSWPPSSTAPRTNPAGRRSPQPGQTVAD